MKSKQLIPLIVAVLAVAIFGYVAAGKTEPQHDEHDHADYAEASLPRAEHQDHDEQQDHDDHEGHDDHDAPDNRDDHEDEGQVVKLTAQQIREIGLKTAIAGPGSIDMYINLPGEIRVNQDRMAHIVPVVPGIARQISKQLGDPVKTGEIIAWLESSDLGTAKMDYLGKWAEMSCCALELTRAQQIHDNTIKLLSLLAESPSLETLQSAGGTEMGDNLSKLVSAYAGYSFAKATYQREKPLYEQKISSTQEFLRAQNAFKTADAQYTATRDSVSFEVKRDLLEANSARQLQAMELKNAQRQLKILGLTDDNITEIELLAKNQIAAPTSESDCDDPNCTECALQPQVATQSMIALAQTEEKLAWYPLIAPFDGTIIAKHIVLGELVATDSAVYVVADLSSVWVDLQAYPKDLQRIKKGQKVVISADSEIPAARGIISYVGPIVGADSRTALARVVLENKSGVFRPGLFVTAQAAVSQTQAKVVVPKDAIQSLAGRKCVFIQDEHGFEPAFVDIGLTTTDHVEILSGLAAGQTYVTTGAFDLKSKIVTSTLDSHAGHGH